MPWVSFQSLRFCSNSLQFCSRECSCIRLAASKLWLLVPLSFNFSPSTSLPVLAPSPLFKSHPVWADHCFSTKSAFAQARYPETSSTLECTNYQNQLETFLRWTQIQIRREIAKPCEILWRNSPEVRWSLTNSCWDRGGLVLVLPQHLAAPTIA